MNFKLFGACFSIVTVGLLAVTQQSSSNNDSLIPKDVIQNLLQSYSEKEKALIAKDLANIRELCFDDKTPIEQGERIYIATAGGPGSCKSTILETYLHDKHNFIYADQDPRALKFMINTYHQSLNYYNISKSLSYQSLLQQMYDKWRRASIYIADIILNEAFDKGYNFAHGTTLSSPILNWNNLKLKNYKIILLVCVAPDDVRIKSIEHRAKEQAFVQSNPADVISQGKNFYKQFSTYFEHADEILFYWTEDFLKGSVLSATFKQGDGLTIHDQEAYKKLTDKYDDMRKEFEIPLLKELVDKHTNKL